MRCGGTMQTTCEPRSTDNLAPGAVTMSKLRAKAGYSSLYAAALARTPGAQSVAAIHD
jgi:hypothetical protein